MRLIAVLMLLLTVPRLVADDAYDSWAAGRPAEALPSLHAAAVASDRWDAWLDLGLAAAAAGRRGPATAWLVSAHRHAPHRPEPRQALAALGSPLPRTWLDRLGPCAWPGNGAVAMPLALLVGMGLGWSIGWRRARGWALIGAGLALLLLLPGVVGGWMDGRRDWAAATADTALLDASGRALRPLPAGTLLERVSGPGWAGHVAVRDLDGAFGWIPAADLVAAP